MIDYDYCNTTFIGIIINYIFILQQSQSIISTILKMFVIFLKNNSIVQGEKGIFPDSPIKKENVVLSNYRNLNIKGNLQLTYLQFDRNLNYLLLV